MSLIWYKNTDTGAEALQAEEGRAILATGSWFPMSEEDVAARDQERAEEAAAVEDAMRADAELARRANGATPPPAAEEVTEEPRQAQIEAARNTTEPASSLTSYESASTEENA